jgi:hypothetical protein
VNQVGKNTKKGVATINIRNDGQPDRVAATQMSADPASGIGHMSA